MCVGSFCASPLTGVCPGTGSQEDRRIAGADVGVGRIFLDPVEHVAAVVVELLKLGVTAPVAGESEGMTAITHVRNPLAKLQGVERRLGAVDGRGRQAGRLAGDRVGAVGPGHVVVKGQPERRAGTRRAAGGGDPGLVDVPLTGL